MKKLIPIITLALFLLGACGNSVKGTALIYGTNEAVKEVIEKEKKYLNKSEVVFYKYTKDSEGKNVMVIDYTSLKKLSEKQLLYKVAEKDKHELYTTLPTLTDGTPLLFGSANMTNLMVDKTLLPVTYSENIVIGKTKGYADYLLVVDDTQFNSMMGTKKTLGVLAYKEDPTERINQLKDKFEFVDVIVADQD